MITLVTEVFGKDCENVPTAGLSRSDKTSPKPLKPVACSPGRIECTQRLTNTTRTCQADVAPTLADNIVQALSHHQTGHAAVKNTACKLDIAECMATPAALQVNAFPGPAGVPNCSRLRSTSREKGQIYFMAVSLATMHAVFLSFCVSTVGYIIARNSVCSNLWLHGWPIH